VLVTTTLPDDPAAPGAVPAPTPDGGPRDGGAGAATTAEGPHPSPARSRGWLARALPGLWFPVVVWLVWRLASLGITLWLDGRGVESAYAYDGTHYLRILHHGYWDPRPAMPSHAFFPGIAWLATPLWWLTGSDAITAHTVASATGLGAFATVWGATREWRDERTARRAVVLLALFPSSLFLWMFYSEALFIALGAGAVWADRRGRHGIAAACFFGIATTRSIGILVPAVVVLARIVRLRRIDRWAVAYTSAGLAGLAAVMATMAWQVGDPLAFLGVQDDWGRDIAWPWSSVIQGFDNLTPERGTVMVPALVARNLDLWMVLVVVVGIVYLGVAGRVGRGGRAQVHRFPMEAWMLGVAMVSLPLASSVLASFNRFALANWVLFPAYAAMLGRLPRWARGIAWLGIAVAGVLVVYALIGRISVGRFVG
jgi:hypothetical protein